MGYPYDSEEDVFEDTDFQKKMMKLSLQQLQQRVQCDLGQSQVQQVAAVHSRAQQAVRQQEPPAEAGGEKFKKLEEKLVRFLENIDSSVRTQERVLKFQVENSIKIIKALGHCSSNQALLLLNCHGEVNHSVIAFTLIIRWYYR